MQACEVCRLHGATSRGQTTQSDAGNGEHTSRNGQTWRKIIQARSYDSSLKPRSQPHGENKTDLEMKVKRNKRGKQKRKDKNRTARSAMSKITA